MSFSFASVFGRSKELFCKMRQTTRNSQHHDNDLKTKTVLGLAIFFAVLLASFVLYGMLLHAVTILDRTFAVVEYGIIFVCIWAGGDAAIKALRRVPPSGRSKALAQASSESLPEAINVHLRR